MKDFPLPVRSVGSGSQPVEDEELQYLEMPRGMNTFRMPVVPERVDAGALGEACDLLDAFLAKLTAWNSATTGPGPRIDLDFSSTLDAALFDDGRNGREYQGA